MTFTNKYNLPETLVRALSFDGYTPGESNISTTSLIGPPRIFQLKKRHKDKIEEDVIEKVWSLLGQAAHVVVERAEGRNSITEERLYLTINGWTISGLPAGR